MKRNLAARRTPQQNDAVRIDIQFMRAFAQEIYCSPRVDGRRWKWRARSQSVKHIGNCESVSSEKLIHRNEVFVVTTVPRSAMDYDDKRACRRTRSGIEVQRQVGAVCGCVGQQSRIDRRRGKASK